MGGRGLGIGGMEKTMGIGKNNGIGKEGGRRNILRMKWAFDNVEGGIGRCYVFELNLDFGVISLSLSLQGGPVFV